MQDSYMYSRNELAWIADAINGTFDSTRSRKVLSLAEKGHTPSVPITRRRYHPDVSPTPVVLQV